LLNYLSEGLSFPGSSVFTTEGSKTSFVLVIKREGWATSVIKKLNPLKSRGFPVASGADQNALSRRESSS
jgi:hypothetical protein